MPTTVKKVTASKSVAKKTAVKKVSSPKKTTAKRSPAAHSLVYADNERSFWVHDGQILNSLVALKDALVKMKKDTFSHHVAKGKNDFADWVEAVLGDSACAADLRKAKTVATTVTVVEKHLTRYHI